MEYIETARYVFKKPHGIFNSIPRVFGKVGRDKYGLHKTIYRAKIGRLEGLKYEIYHVEVMSQFLLRS